MDNKQNIGVHDRDLVNTSEYYELEYWSNKFGVSIEKLKSAVRAVGNSAEAIESHLKSKK
ncbi:DUF3606 domain-containing protein [Mucilaginibacter sp.]|uniref:DUF3606 domain-containing protein n=1 Tax=Mucilaginibacter sp. TaxID=1882438 RepID=UPI003D1419A4